MSNKKAISKKLIYHKKLKQRVKIYIGKDELIGQIISVPWLFSWGSFIFKLDTGEKMKLMFDDINHKLIVPISARVSPIHERKSIPYSIRIKLWKIYFGKSFKGSCFCCREKIEIDMFEAGHIQASCSGGSDSLSNLRPICRSCNRSMGTMDMEDYLHQYFDD